MTRWMMPGLATALVLGAVAASPAIAASGRHAISEAQARNEITLDGYTDVRDLHQVANGWMASAKEGSHQVTVLADNRGNVMKQ